MCGLIYADSTIPWLVHGPGYLIYQHHLLLKVLVKAKEMLVNCCLVGLKGLDEGLDGPVSSTSYLISQRTLNESHTKIAHETCWPHPELHALLD